MTTEEYSKISKKEISTIQIKIREFVYIKKNIKNTEFKVNYNISDFSEKIMESEAIKFREISNIISEAFIIRVYSRNFDKKEMKYKYFKFLKQKKQK